MPPKQPPPAYPRCAPPRQSTSFPQPPLFSRPNTADTWHSSLSEGQSLPPRLRFQLPRQVERRQPPHRNRSLCPCDRDLSSSSIHPGADHLDCHPLSWHSAGHRDELERLQKLWEDSRRLGEYHTKHGEFPADFQRAGHSKAAFIAGKLAALPTPPTTILDVMSSYEVARKYDNLFEQYVHVARAALDKTVSIPLPQGDTVPNSPVPVEQVENVLTNNEDVMETPRSARHVARCDTRTSLDDSLWETKEGDVMDHLVLHDMPLAAGSWTPSGRSHDDEETPT
jgi:hypothetical protein